MRRLVYIVLLVIATISLCCTWTSCAKKEKEEKKTAVKKQRTKQIVTESGQVINIYPDTLHVVTLYSPTSYFLYRDDTLGYDYSLVQQFVKDKKLELDLRIAPSLEAAVNMLDSGQVDLIAYGVPITSDYVKTIYPCGPEDISSQVLVQRIEENKDLITNVTELVGKNVWVLPNSKYYQRLENLNAELGGGIKIKEIDRDTIIDDDIIEMVSRGEIPLSLVDSYTGRLNKTYYNNIDVSLEISFGQKSAWGVRRQLSWLGDSITAWFDSESTRSASAELLRKYFEESKTEPETETLETKIENGDLATFEPLFKKYANKIGWDWHLLAALGYVESHFDNNAISWAGARGLMQIMPSTAQGYGIDPDSLVNPEISIIAAVINLQKSDNILAKYVSDPDERKKFVIAAYNAGIGHILDAITIARKNDLDPKVWTDNVEAALILKSDQRYYNDPEVKYGYFRATETVNHVKKVFSTFYHFLSKSLQTNINNSKKDQKTKKQNK